jgi:class 3 adenylate cyclase
MYEVPAMCADSRTSEGAPPGLPDDCRTETLGVAFFDLSRLAEWTSPAEDELVAAFFQSFYALAESHISGPGGRIVKFMGDAGLCVFPTERADAVIPALADLARAARDCAREFGFDCWLNVNVHAGPVLTGHFGPPGQERYDVIGKTVNVAARLGRRGLTLSAQAFRCLSPEVREQFDKVKPPVTYRLRF